MRWGGVAPPSDVAGQRAAHQVLSPRRDRTPNYKIL